MYIYFIFIRDDSTNKTEQKKTDEKTHQQNIKRNVHLKAA